jgi:hypothetical protein
MRRQRVQQGRVDRARQGLARWQAAQSGFQRLLRQRLRGPARLHRLARKLQVLHDPAVEKVGKGPAHGRQLLHACDGQAQAGGGFIGAVGGRDRALGQRSPDGKEIADLVLELAGHRRHPGSPGDTALADAQQRVHRATLGRQHLLAGRKVKWLRRGYEPGDMGLRHLPERRCAQQSLVPLVRWKVTVDQRQIHVLLDPRLWHTKPGW